MADVSVEVMNLCRLHQEGERHYNRGNMREAIDSFEAAQEKAKLINERHLENICTYNLASVHAANGDKEALEQLLQNLPNQFIDDMLQGGNSISYLRAVANRSLGQYEQALKVVSDSKKRTYLLEQLVELHKEQQDTPKQIKFLEQLKETFRVQLNDMRRFQVTCQLTRLYIRGNRTEDALKVLRELKKEVADYTKLRTGNMSLGNELLRTEARETRCLVPLWNEIGLMFTLLRKDQKALECFKNGLALITNKAPASLLNTAVLKQNIGAVQNMNGQNKEDFELAIKNHSDAIKTFDNYAKENKGSNKGGKKLLRRRLENTCTGSFKPEAAKGNDDKLTYTLLNEKNGRLVIYEALKDDRTACAGAARSFLNMGHARVKLGHRMCAQEMYSQADIYANEAQDTCTRFQANEALASIAMLLPDLRAARRCLLTALRLAVSTDCWGDDEGQAPPDYSHVQRITYKLSKLPVTMTAERAVLTHKHTGKEEETRGTNE